MSPRRILLLLFGLLLLNPGAQTDWEKAAEFRRAENDSRAEKLLSRYASPAHIRALKDEVIRTRATNACTQKECLETTIDGSWPPEERFGFDSIRYMQAYGVPFR